MPRQTVLLSLVVAMVFPLAAGAATPTPAPPATYTPRATETVRVCGADSGRPLLCRGGTEQGKSCQRDAECAGGGICERHGHARDCLEQCQACGDPRTRATPNPLVGLAGDTIGDMVVGACSTEDNTSDILGHPQEVTGTTQLAFTPAGPRLFGANRRMSVVRGWEGDALTATDAPASIFVGQTNPYNRSWDRIAGDLSIGIFANNTSYTFPQDEMFIASDRLGNLWVTDRSSVRRFPAPVFTGQHPDLRLCSERCSAQGLAVGPAGQLAAIDVFRVLIWNDPKRDEQPADLALGAADPNDQPRDCNRGGTAGADTLCRASSAAFDGAGNLFVSDSGNNRILVFRAPLANGAKAVNVLGQPDFTTVTPGGGPGKLNFPQQIAVDGSGDSARVVVADSENDRVLVFEKPFSSRSAAFVVGQPDFTTRNQVGSRVGLWAPVGVAIGNGNLWVASGPFLLHDRIVRYAWPVTQNEPPGLSVLGQPDFETGFSSKVVNRGIKSTSEGGIAFASDGGVYVVSTNENRILRWATTDDATHGRPAAAILGQADGPNEQRRNRGGAVAANTLSGPRGIATSAGGAELYIADQFNNRVLELDDPVRKDDVADRVFGQGGSFTDSACNPKDITAESLCTPNDVFVDADGALWIVDTGNRRVLRFKQPLRSQTADLVLGQRDFTSASKEGCEHPTASTLCEPAGVYVDTKNKRVFVSDNGGTYHSRVLIYEGDLSNGQAATTAVGTGSLTSWSTCKCPPCVATDDDARRNLCSADRITLHPRTGALYVTGGNGPGVVEFLPPFKTGMPMSRSFGCTNPTTWHCAGDIGYIACQWNVSGGLAFDPRTHNLWVMDAASETFRVMVTFDPAAPTPTPTVGAAP